MQETAEEPNGKPFTIKDYVETLGLEPDDVLDVSTPEVGYRASVHEVLATDHAALEVQHATLKEVWLGNAKNSHPVHAVRGGWCGKVLYFEGAGMEGTGGEVGNCRIRTAFTNDAGERLYLEIGGREPCKEWRKRHAEFDDVAAVGCVDHCFCITGGRDDENEHRRPCDHANRFPYTLEAVLHFVNTELGCSFDRVAVAPELSGYRAHGKARGTYNEGDRFALDMAATAKAQAILARERQRQRELGERFPCVSAWRDEDDANLLHVGHHKRCGLEDFDARLD